MRITQYASLVGRENVVAGTDCGFASIVNLHTVLPVIAWEKLRAMRQGADLENASTLVGEFPFPRDQVWRAG